MQFAGNHVRPSTCCLDFTLPRWVFNKFEQNFLESDYTRDTSDDKTLISFFCPQLFIKPAAEGTCSKATSQFP